jgi:hypothetical protein
MKKRFTWPRLTVLAGVSCLAVFSTVLMSSSHREAPLIADDRQADNTDVYAFRSPTDANKVVLIANFIPGQLPSDGPNYYHFSENIRYEIHVDNNVNTPGDDITYRWTFTRMNEDPTTFFNIRLGKENLKTTYTLERSRGSGAFQTIVTNGKVPPYNVGPRSISSMVGLNAPSYESLMMSSIMTASTGEKVFAGPVDDPFFVDAGGIFDLGDAPRTTGTRPRDHLRKLNVHTLALEVDIATLQKNGNPVSMATNILDGDYVIGVWASASRRKMKTLVTGQEAIMMDNNPNDNETKVMDAHTGDWVQVSRLGMPLTNEVINPIGYKDLWNRLTPYQDLANIGIFGKFFNNPELALYMDDTKFGPAVPAFSPLRIQRNSLGEFGFGNGQDGLFILKNTVGVQGSALSESAFGGLLLPGPGMPRSVDIYPIFNTGVPNLPPYQLSVQKGLNPFVAGKPFINNFLPNGGDMLRLNMAVPVTPRNSPDFSNEGLVQAAVLGLTDPRFSGSKALQNIPNMDGFPNGRRLEDDVTRIELQAVSGVVLAAIGFWYDDYQRFVTPSPVTPRLLSVLNYRTGINRNDTALKSVFPFVQTPWPGTFNENCDDQMQMQPGAARPTDVAVNRALNIGAPEIMMTATPNPVTNRTTIRYRLSEGANVQIVVSDANGRTVNVLRNAKQDSGIYNLDWNASNVLKGVYFISIMKDGVVKQTLRILKG